MGKVSAQELAELTPCSLDDVQRLVRLGILSQEDGLFAPRTFTSRRTFTSFV